MRKKLGSILGTFIGAALLVAIGLVAPAAAQSGPYIGLMAGYGIDKLSPADGGTSFDWAQSGAVGGAFAGIGAVVNGIYVGVEGDIAIKDVRASMSDGGYTVTSSADWQGTVRARAGLPMGPALIYGTIGLAMESSKISVTSAGSDSNMLYGLALGGGIEANITKTMFVRVDGRYTKYQDETFAVGEGTAKVSHDGEAAVLGGVGFRF